MDVSITSALHPKEQRVFFIQKNYIYDFKALFWGLEHNTGNL